MGRNTPADHRSVDASAVRFRPMPLTAAAIVGSTVILFDPIFQGLAISLMAGEGASLLLSRMTVPMPYYLAAARNLVKHARKPSSSDEGDMRRPVSESEERAGHEEQHMSQIGG